MALRVCNQKIFHSPVGKVLAGVFTAFKRKFLCARIAITELGKADQLWFRREDICRHKFVKCVDCFANGLLVTLTPGQPTQNAGSILQGLLSSGVMAGIGKFFSRPLEFLFLLAIVSTGPAGAALL